MYTDVLLQEKYRAQKLLISMAQEQGKDYFDFIEEMARELYQSKGWTMNFSKSEVANSPAPSDK